MVTTAPAGEAPTGGADGAIAHTSVTTAAGEAPTGVADGAIAHTSVTTDGATVPMSATTACVAASTGERRIAPLTDLGQPHVSPRGSGARGRRWRPRSASCGNISS